MKAGRRWRGQPDGLVAEKPVKLLDSLPSFRNLVEEGFVFLDAVAHEFRLAQAR
jgi:hypothetical protein